MKSVIYFLLAIVLALPLIGCGAEDSADEGVDFSNAENMTEGVDEELDPGDVGAATPADPL